jgi:hypothetical protein
MGVDVKSRLRSLLCRLGGDDVDLGARAAEEALRVMIVGRPYREPVRVIDALPADLVRDNRRRLQLITGYALTERGTWVAHEWAAGDGAIYDTCRFEAYFGAKVCGLSLDLKLRPATGLALGAPSC